MASDLDNLRTWRSNLISAAAGWTGSGLKEIAIASPTGNSVTYRSLAEITQAIRDANDLISSEDPDVVDSVAY